MYPLYICSDFRRCRRHKFGMVNSLYFAEMSASLRRAVIDYCRDVVSAVFAVRPEDVFNVPCPGVSATPYSGVLRFSVPLNSGASPTEFLFRVEISTNTTN